MMASVALIAAAAVLIYAVLVPRTGAVESDLGVPREPLVIADAPVRGADDAAAVMIVYADFQCPFCGRFTREVLPEIERRYVDTGQVAVVFRHLPLPIHPLATQAAVLAECAGDQGRFWEVHDRMFAETVLNNEHLETIPDAVGLEPLQFARCTADDAVLARVRTSAEEANALGIRGTPAFFLGDRLADGRVRVARAISGARPAEEFIAELDAMLAGETTTGWRSWIGIGGRSG